MWHRTWSRGRRGSPRGMTRRAGGSAGKYRLTAGSTRNGFEQRCPAMRANRYFFRYFSVTGRTGSKHPSTVHDPWSWVRTFRDGWQASSQTQSFDFLLLETKKVRCFVKQRDSNLLDEFFSRTTHRLQISLVQLDHIRFLGPRVEMALFIP